MAAEVLPPQGKITLLFTDIVDSTRMNSALGDAVYTASLRVPHNARLHEAISRHNGFVVKTIGDSFMAAFGSANDALACASAIQQSLTNSPLTATDNTGKAWEVAVRIGVHTSERELFPDSHNDYHGEDVNFAARVEALAKGGQIVVSALTYEAVGRPRLDAGTWEQWSNRYIKSYEDAPQTVYELCWNGQSQGEPGTRWLNLEAYREYMTEKVSRIRVFGEAETRPLEKMFVELTVLENYERPPSHQAEWLGMMDAELRKRRSLFARDEEDREDTPQGAGAERGEKVQRTLRPDELLRERTKAVIAGAPGCGKTTLLRYLTWKTLQEGKRLPVFLELKTISEQDFDAAGGNLVNLLFEKAIAVPLHLADTADRENFRAHFRKRLADGEVTVFLDGLDEVRGTTFFAGLCRSIGEFLSSAYRDNSLLLSTRPYALQTRFEGLKEMEIAPLNPRQIEAFLAHYYGDEARMKTFRQELRRRRDLSDLARVPFLLAVIVYLYRQQGEIVADRLELYKQIVREFVIQLDHEKQAQAFHIPDPGGRRRLRFLKHLAYERLFVDRVGQDAERLVFTSEYLVEKAIAFCGQGIDPDLFAEDVKATPLLREVGKDAFSFVHLTMQEYLAAVALSEQEDCLEIFCRAYFNPTLVAMEVLPMTLGLSGRPGTSCAPDDLYAALAQLPDSLTFVNLRLRARGLAYIDKIAPQHLNQLTERLLDCILEHNIAEMGYKEAILRSFSLINETFKGSIAQRIVPLLQDEDNIVRERAAVALGQIGSEQAIPGLVAALQDEAWGVCWEVAKALGKIRSEVAVPRLLTALQDENNIVRSSAAEALGQIGSEQAIPGLVAALRDKNGRVHHRAVEVTLGQMGVKILKNGLERALNDENEFARQKAAQVIGYYRKSQEYWGG